MKLPELRGVLLEQHRSGEFYQSPMDKAFRLCGFYPRLTCVFEDPRYRALMGGQSIFQRLPADILHVVRFVPALSPFCTCSYAFVYGIVWLRSRFCAVCAAVVAQLRFLRERSHSPSSCCTE